MNEGAQKVAAAPYSNSSYMGRALRNFPGTPFQARANPSPKSCEECPKQSEMSEPRIHDSLNTAMLQRNSGKASREVDLLCEQKVVGKRDTENNTIH